MTVNVIKIWAESHRTWAYIKLDYIYKIPISYETYCYLRDNGTPTAQSERKK